VFYGLADFTGGLLSRSAHFAAVALAGQVGGLIPAVRRPRRRVLEQAPGGAHPPRRAHPRRLGDARTQGRPKPMTRMSWSANAPSPANRWSRPPTGPRRAGIRCSRTRSSA